VQLGNMVSWLDNYFSLKISKHNWFLGAQTSTMVATDWQRFSDRGVGSKLKVGRRRKIYF